MNANDKQAYDALVEVRVEITRINKAAGETVFNPAATQALETVMTFMERDAIRFVK